MCIILNYYLSAKRQCKIYSFNLLASIQSVLAKSKIITIDPSQLAKFPNLSRDVPSVSIVFYSIALIHRKNRTFNHHRLRLTH